MVYTRDAAGAVYKFSHACPTHVPKSLPRSLRVQDLQEFTPRSAEFAKGLMGTAFLVLVAGDRAQCVSVANIRERRIPFLFKGSCYERAAGNSKECSEIDDKYVSLYFYSTISTFTQGYRPSMVPLENGLVLFPKHLKERDIPRLAKWVRHHVEKTIYQSLWVANGVVYNEHTLAPSRKKLALSSCKATPEGVTKQPSSHKTNHESDGTPP